MGDTGTTTISLNIVKPVPAALSTSLFTAKPVPAAFLTVLGFDGGDGSPFSVSGTGWSESGDLANGTGAGGGGCWGTKEQTTAGLTGDATVTSSTSDGSVFFQFAIAPA